ncbi:unnamed protein product [Lactuca virosa]|uniref:Uncharacterized protein n=1 Tax=Lactuca virosa TaxID=75947 RepID=A0AAU9NMV0_9ASTR|nr:unnamed protein product [Lactuca virosa]
MISSTAIDRRQMTFFSFLPLLFQFSSPLTLPHPFSSNTMVTVGIFLRISPSLSSTAITLQHLLIVSALLLSMLMLSGNL